MKNPQATLSDCINKLQHKADRLKAEGAAPALIVAALLHVAIKTAWSDPERGADSLDAAVAFRSAHARSLRAAHAQGRRTQLTSAKESTTKNA